jgi:hypothetical protein
MNKIDIDNIENIESTENASNDITSSIMDATNRLIDQLEFEPSKKTTIRDLIDKVCAATGAKSSVVAGLVPMYAHNNKKISVEVGRGGGVFWGGKPKKVDLRPRCNACNQVLRFNKLKPSEHLVDEISIEESMEDETF